MEYDDYAPRARRGQAARRAATATTILDMAAMIGLGSGILFWGNFFFTIIQPAWLSIDMFLTFAMALGYAIVLPMLLSTLVPSTPAGMLLQSTRWRTWGFAATLAASLYMAWHALIVQMAWWASRPAVVETGQDLWMAIGSCIIFILVPALAWVQAAPDRWVAEVVAAQRVKQLKMAQEASLMLAKAQHLRALSILRRGLANATVNEREEVAATLIMLHRAENESLAQIADGMEAITGIALAIDLPEDRAEVIEAYTGIATDLRRLITEPNEAEYIQNRESPPQQLAHHVEAEAYPPPRYVEQSTANDRERPRERDRERPPASDPARSTVGHSDAETVDRDRDRARATTARSGPQRPVSERDRERLFDAACTAARALGLNAWKRAQLETTLNIEKTTALDLIREWRALGFIVDIREPAHHYVFSNKIIP
jgi:hypothetical protein